LAEDEEVLGQDEIDSLLGELEEEEDVDTAEETGGTGADVTETTGQ